MTVETIQTFEELNLSQFIKSAIADLKFSAPSAVQAEAIPHLMAGEDIIAMAPTGSGKTLAFAIPALEKIDVSDKTIQALVLCPTRELAIQAQREFEKLSKYNEEIQTVSVYGGQQIDRQMKALKRNPQIIIATPGRLMDHLRQGSLKLNNLKYIVLDEADEMLDMGFREDIHTILSQTNDCHQTVLFSATMKKEIRKIAERFQKTPAIVDVLDNLQSAPDIDQFYFEVSERDKPEVITRLLDLHNLNLSLVFCNTKSNVDRLVEILRSRSFSADAIHGDMNQNQREKVMQSFKRGTIKVLVATDVAGRGIDVNNIEAVFNYDLPRDDEDYIHRIGRTGRAGKSGAAFSLVSRAQSSLLKRIERSNGLKITKKDLPSVDEINVAKFENYVSEIKTIIESGELADFRENISMITREGFSELDVAAALYKIMTKSEQAKINANVKFEKTEFSYEDDTKRFKPSRMRRKEGRNDRRSSRNEHGGNSDAKKSFAKSEVENPIMKNNIRRNFETPFFNITSEKKSRSRRKAAKSR